MSILDPSQSKPRMDCLQAVWVAFSLAHGAVGNAMASMAVSDANLSPDSPARAFLTGLGKTFNTHNSYGARQYERLCTCVLSLADKPHKAEEDQLPRLIEAAQAGAADMATALESLCQDHGGLPSVTMAIQHAQTAITRLGELNRALEDMKTAI